MSDSLHAALHRLPHWPEFRFVDQLTALDPGKSGSGSYTVRGTEDFLRGHFPGQPIFPGVLLVEALAQLAGVVAQSDPTMSPLGNLKLTALRAVKIYGTAQPGEVIDLRAEISGRLDGLIQAKGVAAVGDRTLMHAEITLSGEKS